MKTVLFYVTIAVIFVAGTLKVFGQDKAEAPTYKDGDSWIYRSKIGGSSVKSSNDPNGDYELTYSGGKVKALKIEGEQKSATSDRVGDLWVMLALEDIVSKYQYIQFPIFVGKKWSHQYQMTIAGAPYWVDSHTEVTGVEEVTTAAGTFHAFKIERAATGGKGTINQRRVYFYSPQTGTLVKYHMESALGAVSDIELIKFGPKALTHISQQMPPPLHLSRCWQSLSWLSGQPIRGPEERLRKFLHRFELSLSQCL